TGPGKPRRAMNLLNMCKKHSADKLSAISKCTTLVVKHVLSTHYQFYPREDPHVQRYPEFTSHFCKCMSNKHGLSLRDAVV
ncbi:unnamed protein product, partial [Onchocerca ochengi]|uniref:ENTH domain-containing protein n=1 Tax=Onchocerca ochengi TaxID=42157 RepID=A0A182EXK4_ONCOC